MAERIEQRVADIFREDARRAPALSAGLPDQVVHIVRRRRRTRWGIATGLTVAALAIGAPIAHSALSEEPAPPPVAGPSGALPDGGLSDCLPPESVAAVAKRSVSFDGTVTNIVADAGTAGIGLRNATVTFAVHQWFRGGSSATATAIMPAPLPPDHLVGEAGPVYAVGTRLLVSGEMIGGSGRLQARGCGYTRYYDEATAAAWREAVRGR